MVKLNGNKYQHRMSRPTIEQVPESVHVDVKVHLDHDVENGAVVMKFDKAIHELGFDGDQAVNFALGLISHAESLGGVKEGESADITVASDAERGKVLVQFHKYFPAIMFSGDQAVAIANCVIEQAKKLGTTQSASDGHHTFDELYDHRNHLFAALMLSNADISWRSRLHHDGTMYDGFFIAGIRLVPGPISYHLPLSMWDFLDFNDVETLERAPEYDGYTPADVVKRLAESMS